MGEGRERLPPYRARLQPERTGRLGNPASASVRLQRLGRKRKQADELLRQRAVAFDPESALTLQRLHGLAAIDRAGQNRWRSGEDQAGIVQGAARNLDAAAGEMGEKGL